VSKLAEENMKTNPLNNLHIASPCGANWDEMFGNEQKRFCSECELNVYNLSEMSQSEAENFLFNSEGRVCVRLYKRSDGTVITQNCPIGLAKVKQKVSRFAVASFSIISTFLVSILALTFYRNIDTNQIYESIFGKPKEEKSEKFSFTITDGILSNLPEIKADMLRNRIFSK
jgi:hypothetical protein